MAFPNVLSVTPTGVASGTSHTIDMPATVAAGDLLLAVMTWNGDGSATTNGVPSGWSEIGEVSDAPFGYISVLAKIAVGDEGGTTVDFTTSITSPVICHVFRIEKGTWLGSLAGVELGTGVAGSGTTPNPPSLTASWGALENLWLAVAQSTETVDFTAVPASYTNGAETSLADGGEGELSLNTAYRQNAVATEDPGTFTMVSGFWLATTVVVQPANPYPQVLSTTPSVRALVAQTVSWPAATDAGDLLLVFGLATTAISAIAGCTELLSGTLGTYDFGVWAKVADGSEDGGSAAVTGPGSSDLGIYHALRIEAGTWIGSLGGLIVSIIAEGTSTAPDPPEATGPSADYLAVACAGIEEEGGFSSGPSGYTGFTSSDDSTNSSMATAYREVTAAAENPGTFAFAGTADPWGAVTVLVPPSNVVLWEQEGYRWRNDDGSETTATWKEAQDTPITLAAEAVARLRMLLDVTGDPGSVPVTLQFKRDDEAASEWRNV